VGGPARRGFAGRGRVVTGSKDLTALVWDLKPEDKPSGPLWEALSGDNAREAYRARGRMKMAGASAGRPTRASRRRFPPARSTSPISTPSWCTRCAAGSRATTPRPACNERHLMLAAEVSIEASVNDIAQPCGFVWILPPDPGQASHTRASSAATTSVCSSRSVAYANAVSTISASVSAVMSSIAIASRRCGEIVS